MSAEHDEETYKANAAIQALEHGLAEARMEVERLRQEVEDWKQTCTGLRRANANSQSEKRLSVASLENALSTAHAKIVELRGENEQLQREAKWVRNALQEIDEAYQLESPMIRPTKASVISHLNSFLSERDTLAARELGRNTVEIDDLRWGPNWQT